MKRTILLLTVMAVVLSSCATAATPTQIPTKVPIETPTEVSTQTPTEVPSPRVSMTAQTDMTGSAEIELEDKTVTVKVIDQSAPTALLSGVEIQVSEGEGISSLYVEDPSQKYFPSFLSLAEQKPENIVVELVPVEDKTECVLTPPVPAADDPNSYPILAGPLDQNELDSFFKEEGHESLVIFFFFPYEEIQDPGQLRFTVHQGPFEKVYYLSVSSEKKEASGGLIPVAYAAERESPNYVLPLISIGVAAVVYAVGITGATALAIGLIVGFFEDMPVADAPMMTALPDLYGMDKEEVGTALQNICPNGKDCQTIIERPVECIENEEPGRVIAQSPSPGAPVYIDRYSEVRIYYCIHLLIDGEIVEIERKAPTYYPMAVGNYRVTRYTNEEGTQEARGEIVGTKEIEGTMAYISRSTSDQKPGEYTECYSQFRDLYIASWGCNTYNADGTLIRSWTPIDGPNILWEFPFEVGQERRYKWKEEYIGYDKDETSIESFETVHVVEAKESVDVPAGHFEDCFRIRSTDIWDDEDPEDVGWWEDLHWFCPFVGFVKWENVAFGGSALGGGSSELIEYHVQ